MPYVTLATALALLTSAVTAPPTTTESEVVMLPTSAITAPWQATAVVPGPDPARSDRELRQAWDRLEIVVEQYNQVRENLAATQRESAALTTRARPLEATVRSHQARVGELASLAYRSAGVAEVSTLLAATSPEQFADRLLIVRHLANEQSRALGALGRARRGYRAAQASLAALAAEQRRQRDDLASKKRHIEEQIRGWERLRGVRQAGERDRPRQHPGYVPAYAPGRAGAVVRFAYRQLGKPYRWGGAGPSGYDCSGLTLAAWRSEGIGLPHNAASQWRSVTPISRAELRHGDLVFYYRDIHHVALYVGAGRVIHAPNQGEHIRMERMNYAPIYGFGRPS